MSTETTTLRSPTRYFWLQLAALVGGLGVLLLAHHVTRPLDDSAGTTFTTAAVIIVAASALAVVGRAVHVIVTSAFSDAYRVFRSRHLFVCGALLFVVAACTSGVVVARGPFDKLFAYGTITGEHIVDVATVVAAVVCMVGAAVALTGAWDTMRDERNWHRTLHLYTGRRI